MGRHEFKKIWGSNPRSGRSKKICPFFLFIFKFSIQNWVSLILTFFLSRFVKVWIFWEGHKIGKNLPPKIWHYWVASNFKWKIFSNFVAFSEYPNFTLFRNKVEKVRNIYFYWYLICKTKYLQMVYRWFTHNIQFCMQDLKLKRKG